MSRESRSVLERVVAAAAGLLFVAAALTMAIDLLRALWVSLVVIGSIILAICTAVAVFRARSRGW